MTLNPMMVLIAHVLSGWLHIPVSGWTTVSGSNQMALRFAKKEVVG